MNPPKVRGKPKKKFFPNEKSIDNPLLKAFSIISIGEISKQLNVTYRAVQKWSLYGFPMTELSGESTWAKQIEKATAGKVTEAELLAWSFPNRPPCPCNSQTPKRRATDISPSTQPDQR